MLDPPEPGTAEAAPFPQGAEQRLLGTWQPSAKRGDQLLHELFHGVIGEEATFGRRATYSNRPAPGMLYLTQQDWFLVRRRPFMKLIIAIIQPPKLKAVQEALRRIGVSRLSVGDAMGFARQRGQDETYRGAEYKTNLLRKVALEIAVNDDFVEKTIECLEQVARTGGEGTIGDGKVFVLPMDEAIQVSDGARGPGAI
jgi:nitrogen regulatory protein PII